MPRFSRKEATKQVFFYVTNRSHSMCTVVWHRGSIVWHINKVIQCWANSVPVWVTVLGWIYRLGM